MYVRSPTLNNVKTGKGKIHIFYILFIILQVDLYNCRFVGKAKILNSDGSPLDADDVVSPLNLFASSMLER
jgi:hypothetical protein